MAETLYLDLLFLVNLAADLWLLVLTGLVLKESMRKRKGRLLLGAAAGAGTGCVLIFLPGLPFPVWVFLELFLPALLMTRIAFGSCSFGEAARRILTLWMAAVLTGGSFSLLESAGGSRKVSAAWNASQASSGAVAAVWKQTPWTFWRFGLMLSAAGGVLWAGIAFLRQGMTFRNSLYEVTLYYQGRKKEVLALLDTGNQLYEPYSHQPVHILERSACREFDGAVLEIRYIPFCSVGNESGVLAAVRMERMEIWQQGKQIRVLERPWVAICQTPLSPRHQYEMLLHGEL